MAGSRRTFIAGAAATLAGVGRALASESSTEEGALFAGPTSSFRMNIVGYQFPSNVSGDDDSNWLMVAGAVNIEGRQWQFVDPCLETHELQRLIDWIDNLVAGRQTKAYCRFTEPNLEFECVDSKSLRISFALESAPPWRTRKDALERYGFDMPIGPELSATNLALKRQLARFPIRWPAG